MPATTVNITYNNGLNKWQSNTANAAISKSGGIIFNIGNIPNGVSGVRICLSNSNVFGVTFLEYTSNGNQQPAVTGSVGQSSGYNLQNAGSACSASITDDDPYEVTITSSVEEDEAKYAAGA